MCSRTSLNAVSYVSDILEDHLMPFAPFIGENFLLLHDNARPHTARVVNEYLNEAGISLLNFPARSPDLNPIEQRSATQMYWRATKQIIKTTAH